VLLSYRPALCPSQAQQRHLLIGGQLTPERRDIGRVHLFEQSCELVVAALSEKRANRAWTPLVSLHGIDYPSDSGDQS
jgi:hypothetical protein